MISTDIFLMQADKLCHELFEQFSETLFSRIELKQFGEEYEIASGGDRPQNTQNTLVLILLRDQLNSELESTGERYVISDGFVCNQKINYFIIYFNKENRKTFDKYQFFFDRLQKCLFGYLIKAFEEDAEYFYNGTIHSLITRDSIDLLLTEISRKCSNNSEVSLYDSINLSLKNILSELSSLTYEKSETKGLIYFISSPKDVNFQFEFENYKEYGNFDFKNIRLLRKLVELTDIKTGVGIISDTNWIYGLGTVKDGCDSFSVTFDDDRCWTVYEKGNEMISIRNNTLIFASNLISKREFTTYLANVFPEKKDTEEISLLYGIIKTLVKQKKGTVLVVKKNAEDLMKKYQDLSMSVKPVKLDEKNVERLSSIDGAIIMDENCICYGFGAVLDGLDTGTGNRARGARFNSCERFYNLYKNDENTDLMVFILSDDGNFNFFP